MAKVQLGKAPKHFKKPVDIVLLSGAVAQLEISYIYRTRAEFAELIDKRLQSAIDDAEAEAKAEKEATEAQAGTENKPRIAVAEQFRIKDEAGAGFVLQIANGWDLDDPFTEASLMQLENENPGSLAAIASTYRQAVAEARVKN